MKKDIDLGGAIKRLEDLVRSMRPTDILDVCVALKEYLARDAGREGGADRQQYMRDYMRRYRAQKRASKDKE